MQQYLSLLEKVLARGNEKPDRTGTGTYSLFGEQLRFDLNAGFPLLTTKKLHFHSIRTELLWMLRGDTNTAYLHDHAVTIWDEWASANGDLGPVYGAQWRFWDDNEYGGSAAQIDQMRDLIEGLRRDPHGRRHIVTAWNPSDIPSMALPPCHLLFQFYVTGREQDETMRLHCHLYQRSADIFLGVPYNIASYATLTNLLALELHMEVGDLVISFGDVHLYKNHVEQAKLQLSREPRELPSLGVCFKPGALLYRKGSKQVHYDPQDIFVGNYNPHPSIKAEVAV